MSNKSVSVIVVFHRTDYIESCLEALFLQTVGAGEIIAVDNSLNPRFSDHLQRRYPSLRWVRGQKNLSYCEALNAGISLAGGAFILCLNDDVRLARDYLEEVLKGFSSQARIGMVSGKILRPDQKTLDSTGQFLSLFYTARERGYGVKDSGQFDRPGRVFGVTGAAGFYRKQMLEDIREGPHYFDPAFRYFYEDLDVAWRGRRRGWSAAYVPSARAVHVRGATVRNPQGIGRPWARRFLNDDLYLDLVKNRYLTIARNARPVALLWHLPFVLCYEVASWALVVLLRPKVAGAFLSFLFKKCFFRRIMNPRQAPHG